MDQSCFSRLQELDKQRDRKSPCVCVHYCSKSLQLFFVLAIVFASLSLFQNLPVEAQDEIPLWRKNLSCPIGLQKYQGLEYCTGLNGNARVIVIDLNDSNTRFEYVIAEGVDRNNNKGPCQDVNLPAWSRGPGCFDENNKQYYPVFSLFDAVERIPEAAVVINSDYGAGTQGTPGQYRGHGPEGFAVIQGHRIDGPKVGDTDDNAVNRPWLAIGNTPLRVELSQFEEGKDDGSTPEWIYTGVSGAPWLIRDGILQETDIATCKNATLHSCTSTVAQTAVGISKDQRWLFLVLIVGQNALGTAKFMLDQLDTGQAIKFDGGGSSQLYFGGLPGDNIIAKSFRADGRYLSQYLAIVARAGSGIDLHGTAATPDISTPVISSEVPSAVPIATSTPSPNTGPSFWGTLVQTIQSWFAGPRVIHGFGMGSSTHLNVGTDDHHLQDALDMQQSLGVQWSREVIPWEEVEHTQNNYRWQYGFNRANTGDPIPRDFDLLFNEMRQRNIRPLVVLAYGPFYAEKPVPDDVLVARWSDYVQKVVDRYGDQIDAWEIGNEMNSPEFWGKVVYPDGTQHFMEPKPALYARMLKAAHDIIKRSNPNDIVVLGGLVTVTDGTCPTNLFEYLKGLHDAGAWSAFEVVAIHPYWGDHAPEEFIDRGLAHDPATGACLADQHETTNMVGEIRSVMDLINKYDAKPIWVTEIGWDQAWVANRAGQRGTSPDQVEADYVARTYVPLLSETGVENVFWYTLTGDTQEEDFRLGTPGQRVFQNLSDLLIGSQPLGQYQGENDQNRPGDDDVYEYRFTKGSETIIVIWKARGGEKVREVVIRDLTSETLLMYPANAGSLSPESGQTKTVKDGMLTIQLNEHPVILIGETSNWWERLGNWWEEWSHDPFAGIRKWWEQQVQNMQKAFEQWLQEQERKLLELFEQTVNQWVTQCCGGALVPVGLVAGVGILRYRQKRK